MPNRDRELRKVEGELKKNKEKGLMSPSLKTRQRGFKTESWYAVAAGKLSAARTNIRSGIKVGSGAHSADAD